MESIAVVDLAPISTESGRVPSEADWKLVSTEVDRALSQIGFVYLKNHGIPQENVEQCFKESLKFFELSPEIKIKYMKDVKKSTTGYSLPNQEQLDPSSSFEYRETFDIQENHGSMEFISSLDTEVPQFKPSLFQLKKACSPLLDKLHRILARGLQLDDTEFFIKRNQFLNDTSVPSITTFRTLYYPAISESMTIDAGTVRCAPHSDYGTLTLLFQDGIGGLEVKNAKDVWVPATPIPGTILLNTGDLLYFWSGGRYPATVHRVLIPESEIKKRVARQSIAYFVHPDDDVQVFPVNSNGLDDTIKPVSAYDHTIKRLNTSYKF